MSSWGTDPRYAYIRLSEEQRLSDLNNRRQKAELAVEELKRRNASLMLDNIKLNERLHDLSGFTDKIIKTIEERLPMTSKTVGKVKLKTDAKGKTKLTRVHTYDASKARKIAKAKTKRVVPGQRLNTSVEGLRGGQQRTNKRSMR